jgi:hypothetical protein
VQLLEFGRIEAAQIGQGSAVDADRESDADVVQYDGLGPGRDQGNWRRAGAPNVEDPTVVGERREPRLCFAGRTDSAAWPAAVRAERSNAVPWNRLFLAFRRAVPAASERHAKTGINAIFADHFSR